MSTTAYQYVDGVKSTTTASFIAHTVTSDEASANEIVLATPSNTIAGAHVSILRAGVDVKDAAVVTWTGAELKIEDGGSYSATVGDIVVATVFGSL